MSFHVGETRESNSEPASMLLALFVKGMMGVTLFKENEMRLRERGDNESDENTYESWASAAGTRAR